MKYYRTLLASVLLVSLTLYSNVFSYSGGSGINNPATYVDGTTIKPVDPTLSFEGGGGGTTNFSDADFSVFNDTDNTKIAVQSSVGITTGTTRTFTYPDNDGTYITSGNLNDITDTGTLGDLSVGFDNTLSGIRNASFGFNNLNTGNYSYTFGINNNAGGPVSLAGGRSKTTGNYTISYGYEAQSDAYAAASFGQYNTGGGTPDSFVLTDPIFQVGIGLSAVAKDNAINILKNGKISIGGVPLTNENDLLLNRSGVLAGKETTTPTADAGHWKLYAKSDNVLYFQDGSGVENPISYDLARVKTKTGTHTLEIVDQSYVIEFNNSSNSYDLTIPPNSSVAFPIGAWVEIRKTGTGDITITKGAGVTFRGELGDVNINIDGQDGNSVFLEKTATDTWLLSGSIKSI